MKFTLEIQMGSEKMQTNAHVARELAAVARQLRPEFGMGGGTICDPDGHDVGRFSFEADDAGGETEHLDFVEVIEVFEREDGVYVFADLGDAHRFEKAVAQSRDLPEDESASHRQETPINRGAAAERLIAAERGDVLENLDWPNVAEDVREGIPLPTIRTRLAEIEGGEVGEAVALLTGWIEEDEKERPLVEAADMSTSDGLGGDEADSRDAAIVGGRIRLDLGGENYLWLTPSDVLRRVSALNNIAAKLPTDDEWDSAADFMEEAAAAVEWAGVERPAHYPED